MQMAIVSLSRPALDSQATSYKASQKSSVMVTFYDFWIRDGCHHHQMSFIGPKEQQETRCDERKELGLVQSLAPINHRAFKTDQSKSNVCHHGQHRL